MLQRILQIFVIVTACRTETICIYKKLLNVKCHRMKTKGIEISTLLRSCFKKTKISKQLIVNRMNVHWMEQHLKASEFLNDRSRSGTSKVLKPRSYQKILRKRPLPENDKTEEENFSLHCVQGGQKDGWKTSERGQETPVESCNGSEVSGEEHAFVE